MAKRRMFSLDIVDTDAFLEMPSSTQMLYFHFGMRADDEGFVGNPKRLIRMLGVSEDDYKLLVHKNFIIIFESGVCVVKHWNMNNYLQNDRIKKTTYIDERKSLDIKENKAYTLNIDDVYKMDTKCIHSVVENRVVQNRIDKSSIKDIVPVETETLPYSDIVNYLNLKCNTNYRPSGKKTKELIKARFNEKFTLDNFKTVIDKKSKEWLKSDMEKFLRPETLFGTKFESYLNMVINTYDKTNRNVKETKKPEWLDEFNEEMFGGE